MSRSFILTILFGAGMIFLPLSGEEKVPCRYDFSKESLFKKTWHWRGKQLGIPKTRFYVGDSAAALDKKSLFLEANGSSGVIITQIPPHIWKNYPVMRWRWRILRKVKFDKKELDDQAAVLYFGDGNTLKQTMLAYSWENFTPLETRTTVRYGMGSRTIYRICARNKDAALSKWYEEERNVVEDFKKAVGRAPKGVCGLTIGANSQYSKSNTLVEIDFIEFRKTKKKVSSSAVQGRKIAERRAEK